MSRYRCRSARTKPASTLPEILVYPVTMRWQISAGLALLLAVVHCGDSADTAKDSTSAQGSGGANSVASTGGSGGAGGSLASPTLCDDLSLPTIAFNDAGPFGSRRHDLAENFTVALQDGTSWTFADKHIGCESYIFVTSARARSAQDATSLWESDLDDLVERSPANAHYFFLTARSPSAAIAEAEAMQGRVDALLLSFDAAKAEHWRQRLHVLAKHANEQEGWLKNLAAGIGRAGFAIDRQQRIRLLGSFADVNRYRKALADADEWPWESNLAYAAYEPRYYNFLVTRDAKLTAENESTTIVSAVNGEVMQYQVEIDVVFPDASAMENFDTLEIDLSMDCPNPAAGEFGNCGAWDYLSHIRLLDEDQSSWIEMARFITTYHREGRYLVDATPMLAFLKKGGMRKIRYDVSPQHNQQAYLTHMDFRFSNRGKGYQPSDAIPLFSGGGFNSTYNDKYTPKDIAIPADAKRIELWAIITGHGGATQNCAEFCRHQHEFTVNGITYLKDHEQVGKNMGCVDEIDNGMVPNQGGTWWLGRGGWCPGQQVEPWVVDVTADVEKGKSASFAYRGLLKGNTPPDNAGNIRMTSYLVIHR
jgi:hypothetical protein